MGKIVDRSVQSEAHYKIAELAARAAADQLRIRAARGQIKSPQKAAEVVVAAWAAALEVARKADGYVPPIQTQNSDADEGMTESAVRPHPMFPHEMLIRCSVYSGDHESIQMAVANKENTWAIFGTGKTLAEAAAELFCVLDCKGGLAKTMQSSLDNARTLGFIPVCNS